MGYEKMCNQGYYKWEGHSTSDGSYYGNVLIWGDLYLTFKPFPDDMVKCYDSPDK